MRITILVYRNIGNEVAILSEKCGTVRRNLGKRYRKKYNSNFKSMDGHYGGSRGWFDEKGSNKECEVRKELSIFSLIEIYLFQR